MQKAHGLIREIVRYIGIRLEVPGEGWGFGVGGLGIAFGLWGSQEKFDVSLIGVGGVD